MCVSHLGAEPCHDGAGEVPLMSSAGVVASFINCFAHLETFVTPVCLLTTQAAISRHLTPAPAVFATFAGLFFFSANPSKPCGVRSEPTSTLSENIERGRERKRGCVCVCRCTHMCESGPQNNTSDSSVCHHDGHFECSVNFLKEASTYIYLPILTQKKKILC